MPTGSVTARRQGSSDTSRRLQALTDIGCLVTLGLDPRAIVSHTAQAVARLLDAPYARIWQLDEASGDLVLVAVAGPLSPSEDIGRRRSAALNTLNHQVLARGQIYQTKHILGEPGWVNSEVSERLNLHTYVGVPLMIGERKYGILSLRFTDRRVICQEDLELVQAFVAQAAVALHNAAAYAESRRHEERLTILAEITRLINSNLEPASVLTAAAQAAQRLLSACSASVWLYDESTQLLHLQAHEPGDDGLGLHTLRMNDSLAGWVLQLREPYTCQEVDRHPLWKRSMSPVGAARRGIFVPFFDQDRPLGVLVALGQQDQPFDQRDVDLLRALSDQVVVATQNARLYAAARDQARQLATLMHVNRHLALGPRIEEILETIVEDAARLLGVEGGGLRLVDGGHLVHAASFGAAAALVMRERHSADEGLSGEVVRLRRTVTCTELRSDPRVTEEHRVLASSLGFHGWLGVPLRGRSSVVGALFVIRRQEGPFSETDIGLLEAFADQAAVGIENARLFAQEQARQQQLELIREFASDLTQELDLSRVVSLATVSAAQLLRARSGAIFLWDESAETLRRAAGHGWAADVALPSLGLGEGISGTAAQRRETVIENDYRRSPFALPQVLESNDVGASIAQPILFQDRLIGVITVSDDDPTRRFSESDARLLAIFAGQAAIAIENARLFRQAARAEALDELARLKTEFLSTVSHELRTPLSLIHGYSELLVARGERLSSAQVQEMAKEIHTGSRTMAALVDDLLDFSRIEQGRLHLQKSRVSITELLEQTAAEFGQSVGERFSAHIDAGLEGEVDPDRLTQVVTGLLANAARFAPTGSITLTAESCEGGLRVQVTDEGPGVPESEQERVWEKFFRGASAVNSPVRGSGLGLALVKHIVTLHGGTVGVQSKPGQGATFWIELPV